MVCGLRASWPGQSGQALSLGQLPSPSSWITQLWVIGSFLSSILLLLAGDWPISRPPQIHMMSPAFCQGARRVTAMASELEGACEARSAATSAGAPSARRPQLGRTNFVLERGGGFF